MSTEMSDDTRDAKRVVSRSQTLIEARQSLVPFQARTLG
jgi:hypothetical protein